MLHFWMQKQLFNISIRPNEQITAFHILLHIQAVELISQEIKTAIRMNKPHSPVHVRRILFAIKSLMTHGDDARHDDVTFIATRHCWHCWHLFEYALYFLVSGEGNFVRIIYPNLWFSNTLYVPYMYLIYLIYGHSLCTKMTKIPLFPSLSLFLPPPFPLSLSLSLSLQQKFPHKLRTTSGGSIAQTQWISHLRTFSSDGKYELLNFPHSLSVPWCSMLNAPAFVFVLQLHTKWTHKLLTYILMND